MKVVVTGATGNVGTALLDALDRDPAVDAVVGVARRPPGRAAGAYAKVEWVTADLVTDPLEPLLAGADAVVHLAWLIQPSRRRDVMRTVNVEGSRRLFDAVVAAGVAALVHASSVGTYAPGPKHRAVDESWSTAGVPTSGYSVDKAAVERLLDGVEAAHPSLRVVRLRPGLVLQSAAASEISRLFLGPLVPTRLLRPGLLPVVPDIAGLRIQAVHTEDCAEAYRLAVHADVRGPFNIAADPLLDPASLADALHAVRVPLPARPVRALADWTWRLHLQQADVGWFDLATQVPVMASDRARRELGWQPRWSATDTVRDLLDGFGRREHGLTAPLAAGAEVGASSSPAPGPAVPAGAGAAR